MDPQGNAPEKLSADLGSFFGGDSSKRLSLNWDWNWKEIIKRKLPILRWLPTYTFAIFLQDALSGFTVGLTLVPQGIAYAIVAGLPTQYGLYCGFMGPFMYILLGSCMSLTIGPTAIMALMIQPHVRRMGEAGAILICFLSGCIIFLLGILHLGFIIEFFSYPIISGYTTAAALNIASSQLKSLFGISGDADGFMDTLIYVFGHIRETRKWDTILGFLSIIFLVISKEIRRYGTLNGRLDWSRRRNIIGRCIFMFSLASNAIAVIIGTTIAYVYHQQGSSPFILTGAVEGGLPPFSPPPFSTTFNGTEFSFIDMAQDYGTVIIFCPLVAILGHVAIAKAFSKGKALDASQELIALGISNIMGSFVRSMPVTGSFTRTAVNNASGARTTAGGIITGIMILLALGFLTNTFEYIPKATLAAVILVAMYYLCDFAAFPLLWRTKKLDLIPLLVTIICGLAFSLEYGILIGTGINIIFILYASARPKLIIEKPRDDVYLIKFKTGMYFSAAEYMREHILEKCSGEGTTVIVDGKYLGNIDATVAKSFSVLREELEIRNQKLLLVNFKKSVKDICLGADKRLERYFKDEGLEQIVVPLALKEPSDNK